jgi:hypothetical protein
MTAAAKQTVADFESGPTSAQEAGAPIASEWERQCRTYARHLSGRAPSRYIIEKYQDFHQKIGLANGDAFDEVLVSLSARGPFWVQLADCYTTFSCRNSVLRKKLIVTLALLEAAPPTFEILDSVPSGGCLGALLRLGTGAFRYVLLSFLAAALLTPIRLFTMARNR